MGKISKIIIHCSDSDFGTAITIDGWHRAQGWKKIGYAGVILNGQIKHDFFDPLSDGAWEWGRAVDSDPYIEPDEIGSHVLGLNSSAVGICLIGKTVFSKAQYETAKLRISSMMEKWGLTSKDVLGHYEVDKHGKTCPNILMDFFRKYLDNKIGVLQLQSECRISKLNRGI
jgi:hypothetical protein